MRKGFTLIEMILVLAIMSLVSGVCVVSVGHYKTMENSVDADYYCNAVVDFINNSKMYCRENACSVIVTFDKVKNEIRIANGMKVVNKLVLKNKITLYKFTGRNSNTQIVIDNKGYSNDAFTIILKDNNSIKHEITMRVGTAYVKINE
ncbi:MAG: type II secretion system GspH family protein [Clostridiaceae bacterium]|nr:type II secretion system GspH family protein [Clostridiaceae bacterium]